MISGIIFSKNRACQLHLLLESIQFNGREWFDLNILYRATNKEFQAGYDKVIAFFPYYNWYKQTDFQTDTLKLIYRGNKHICFFVDDDFLFRKIPLCSEEVLDILKEYNVEIISLRLGKNTVIQDQYIQSKTLIPNELDSVKENEIFIWNWFPIKEHTNFGYPFSVDGHIYKRETLLKTLDFEFDTPNAFEGRFDVNKLSHLMCCFGQSIVVNNPINIVGSSENKAGIRYGISLKEFNDKYLKGYTINLEEMCKNNIVGCHQEMEIKFK